jgi:hypothetical protein
MAGEPKTVLLDNSVMSVALVAHGITVPVPGFANRLYLVQAKPVRAAPEKWLRQQIECLPTIARLARTGMLRLHSYDELTLEAWRRPGSYPADPFGDVFEKIEIVNVPSAVRRGLFFQSDLSKHIEAEALTRFCKWLLNGYSDQWLDAPYVRDKLTDFERRNLQAVDRLKAICRPLPDKHYGDGFHLWTGEANGLSYFLTTDRKFVRPVTNQGKRTLPCQPIYPSELLDDLGIKERDPLPYEYGRRYTLGGQPYD